MARGRIGLLCALALSVSGLTACTDEKEPQGQLMLAFDTDMAVPKDVNAVQLEAHIGNSGQLLNFDVGPTTNRLPATFGLRTGDGKGKTVDVTLLAHKGTKVRTVATTRTSIPPERIALLRMPIDWLCTLRVDGELNEYDSDCGSGETCVAGSCVSSDVDEKDLPTYDPSDVFGGGTGDGESGICFDASEAFREDRAAVRNPDIDLDTCRVELKSDGEKGNLALRVRKGDGICISSDLCLVTLNKSKTSGWYEVDEEGEEASGGGYAQLPKAVCEELSPTGAIIGVYEGAYVPQKVAGIPVCSAWSSAGSPDVTDPGDDVDPHLLCPEAGSGKAGADFVEDPRVATYLDVSDELTAEGVALMAQTGEACVTIASALDADDVWTPLGYDAELPTRGSVRAACAQAAKSLGEALVDTVRLRLGVAPERCEFDSSLQTECESSCAPDDECEDDSRCRLEDEVASCNSTCDGGSVCEGTVAEVVQCNGSCDGVCEGVCSGVCTRYDDNYQCQGFCELGTCEGRCLGECTLEDNLSCGTGGACRGGCSGASKDKSCSAPLAACDAIDESCTALCATHAVATANCQSGGVFSAVSSWPLADEFKGLEKILTSVVLPALGLLDDARHRVTLLSAQASDVDPTDIVAKADAASQKDGACAKVADEATVDALADFELLAELGGTVLELALDYRPPTPPQCEQALEGDPCQACIAENCCSELVDCTGDSQCFGNGSTTGQLSCVLSCVANLVGEDEEVSDEVKAQCAADCTPSGKKTLQTSTVAMLECVNSNVNGGCSICYDVLGSDSGSGGSGGSGGGGQGSGAMSAGGTDTGGNAGESAAGTSGQ